MTGPRRADAAGLVLAGDPRLRAGRHRRLLPASPEPPCRPLPGARTRAAWPRTGSSSSGGRSPRIRPRTQVCNSARVGLKHPLTTHRSDGLSAPERIDFRRTLARSDARHIIYYTPRRGRPAFDPQYRSTRGTHIPQALSQWWNHDPRRRIRPRRPGQRRGRQAPRLDAGLAGEAGGGRRAAVRRRVLPEHRLPAEQERHPQRQGRPLLPPRRTSSGSAPTAGRSTWPPSATASGRWWTGWSRCTSRSTGRAAPSSSWAAATSSAPKTDRGRAQRGRDADALAAQTVVINTGSRARIDDTPGLAEARPLTHVEALELDQLPEHLIVLGGGYVGLELAQAFRRFGSRVTVVERNGALIHREDPDVTEAVERSSSGTRGSRS